MSRTFLHVKCKSEPQSVLSSFSDRNMNSGEPLGPLRTVCAEHLIQHSEFGWLSCQEGDSGDAPGPRADKINKGMTTQKDTGALCMKTQDSGQALTILIL